MKLSNRLATRAEPIFVVDAKFTHGSIQIGHRKTGS